MRETRTVYDEPPPGFRGLNPDAPVTVYHRHLPHWRQDGATYFVTFRLADALPHEAVEELRAEREAWLAAHPGFAENVGRDRNPDFPNASGLRSRPTPEKSGLRSRPTAETDRALWREYERLSFVSLERWLDAGWGGCALAGRNEQETLADELTRGDGTRYALGCYVIMPNHVHAVVRPLENVGRDRNPDLVQGCRDCDPDLRVRLCYPLEDIVGAWKRWSARVLGEVCCWQNETYDRIVRDTAELNRTVTYIARNPAKAGCAGRFWLRPDWKDVGRDRNPDLEDVGRDRNPDLEDVGRDRNPDLKNVGRDRNPDCKT